MLGRCVGALLSVVVLVLVFTAPAVAGSWAITALDPLPAELRAGQTYGVGYTILQHGQTPFDQARSAIVAHASTGETIRFRGERNGPAGHYAAEVRFPAAGTWAWEIDQSPFAVQSLGSVTVLAQAGTAAPAPTTGREPRRMTLRLAVALAAAGACTLFVSRLASLLPSLRPVIRPRPEPARGTE